MISCTGSSKKYHHQLELEHSDHDDLVQGSVTDSYDTLSYKSLMGFLWTNINCPGARFIAKTDDDVHLDTRKVSN